MIRVMINPVSRGSVLSNKLTIKQQIITDKINNNGDVGKNANKVENLNNQKLQLVENNRILNTHTTVLGKYLVSSYTRSAIYSKVIEYMQTQTNNPVDIFSLTLTHLDVRGNGMNKMNVYLTEIKQAIITKDNHNLGKRYKNIIDTIDEFRLFDVREVLSVCDKRSVSLRPEDISKVLPPIGFRRIM